MKKQIKRLMAWNLAITILLTGCGENAVINSINQSDAVSKIGAASSEIDFASLPEYSGKPYVVVNHNTPVFTEEDKKSTASFECYSQLDELGRCGVAYANVGKEIMPTTERGKIGEIKPTGWHTVKYDCVDGKYLYNRCHLIGYQLSAENANEKNLITGTRYFNVQGMLPFENMVADYVKETNAHVLYRVTPVYQGNNLVANGVLMEAWSVEDQGKSICFCVFVYNIQPGITIDYVTGESSLGKNVENGTNSGNMVETKTYIINKNSKKFHLPSCKSVSKMKDENKQEVTDTKENLEEKGYSPCKNCIGN